MVVTEFKVDLEEFRYLMRLELLREETRKAALHALIEEIVAYPDAMIEVKYRIRNWYRTEKQSKVDNTPVYVPPPVNIPRRGTELRPGKINYLHTWHYDPSTLRV